VRRSLGSGEVTENIGGAGLGWGRKLFCKPVVDGGVLRGCGTWEDVCMKCKSIYSILFWYESRCPWTSK
jgi:hypothetical protein